LYVYITDPDSETPYFHIVVGASQHLILLRSPLSTAGCVSGLPGSVNVGFHQWRKSAK